MSKTLSTHLESIAQFLQTAAITHKGPLTRSEIFKKCPGIRGRITTQNSLNTLMIKAEKTGDLMTANIQVNRLAGNVTYQYVETKEFKANSFEEIDEQLALAVAELAEREDRAIAAGKAYRALYSTLTFYR